MRRARYPTVLYIIDAVDTGVSVISTAETSEKWIDADRAVRCHELIAPDTKLVE